MAKTKVPTTQKTLKQAIKIVNSLKYPIRAETDIAPAPDGNGDEALAIDLVANPGGRREFWAYLTADGRILFENTCEHHTDGAERIHVAHSFDNLLWLGRIISVIQPLIETQKEKKSLPEDTGRGA